MALTKIPSSLLDTSGGFDLQGNITLGDNEQIQFGDSSDLQIYHNGSNSLILNTTGTLNLRNQADDLDIAIQTDDGSGNTTDYFRADGSTGSAILYNYGNIKLKTTSTGATVTGTLTVTGDLDITGNVNSYNVTDLDVTDQTITLGAGQTEANSGGSGIIIDGSNASILWDETDGRFEMNNDLRVGNGLFFGSQDFYFYRSAADVATLRIGDDGSYKYFSFTDTGTVARFSSAAGAVSLGSGANDHLLINSSGLVMIGTSTPSGLLNVDGNLHYGGQLRVNDPSHDGTESNPSICVGYDNDNGFFRPTSNTIGMTTAGTERMRITATGNVGIGTDSPSELLHIYNLSNDANILIEGNGPGANAKLTIDGHVSGGQLHLTYRSDTQSKTVAMECLNDGSFTVDTLGSESMRIDASGNLLVGKTSPLTTSVGAEIRPIGFITSFRTSGAPALFARGTDDGDVVVFRKDSTTVGVIGTEGTDLTIGSGGAGFQFLESENKIRPFNVSTNSASNGVVDLGRANANFKDLYLSGAIKLGSDLDDYEEGTFSPTLANASNITSLSLSEAGRYVKIGNLVHFECQVEGNITSASSEARFSFTLPFNTATSTPRAVGMFAFLKEGTFSNDRFSNGQIYQGTNANSFIYVYIGSTQIPNNGGFTGRLTLTYQSA